jgi:uncharacterized membrane protein (UPF0127 family)
MSVTYPLVVRNVRLVVLALAIACLLANAAAAAIASEQTTAALRLDGVPFRPELAMTPAQRSLGLMNRTRAPRDGMLFVFPETTTGGFWMKNTLVPLTIVFFDSAGKRVRKLSMTPCRKDPCPIYDPGRPYRFALELRATESRPATRIGPLAELRRLVRLAR